LIRQSLKRFIQTGFLPPCLILALAVNVSLPRAAGAAETAAGVVLYQQINANTFRYNIELKNTGTTNLGTLWYSWVPGEDFLGANPTNIVSPAGWTANVTHAGANDGFAIQWVNGGGAIASGKVVSGFGFDSSETPTDLAGKSPAFPATAISTSFIYAGAPLSDAGFQFSVAPTTHPWQNPFTPDDVNHDGNVNPQDVLAIIDELLHNSSHTLGTPVVGQGPQPFLDVDGDNFVKPSDVLAVIDVLLHATPASGAVPQLGLAQSLSASVMAASIQTVPEPSASMLALIAAALLSAAWIHHCLGKYRRARG
jgi:hypothetical protein